MTKQPDFGSESSKQRELESKLRELRNEKITLTETFVAGRIPRDIYRKAVIQIQKRIDTIEKEIRRNKTST